MLNPEAYVRFKDMPNVNDLVRRGAANLFNIPLTINGITIKANGFIVGVPKNVHSDLTDTGNVGAGLDVIRSISIPANTLLNNGDYLQFELSGNGQAAGLVTRRWTYNIGGTTTKDFQFSIDNPSWSSNMHISRLSATTVRVSGQFLATTQADEAAGEAVWATLNSIASLTVPDLNANALIITLGGEHVGGASNNVVKCSKSVVEAVQIT